MRNKFLLYMICRKWISYFGNATVFILFYVRAIFMRYIFFTFSYAIYCSNRTYILFIEIRLIWSHILKYVLIFLIFWKWISCFGNATVFIRILSRKWISYFCNAIVFIRIIYRKWISCFGNATVFFLFYVRAVFMRHICFTFSYAIYCWNMT